MAVSSSQAPGTSSPGISACQAFNGAQSLDGAGRRLAQIGFCHTVIGGIAAKRQVSRIREGADFPLKPGVCLA
jgi:hypothetical protein